MGDNTNAYIIIGLAVLIGIVAFVYYYYTKMPKAPTCYEKAQSTGCKLEGDSCLFKKCCEGCGFECKWVSNPFSGFRECVKVG